GYGAGRRGGPRHGLCIGGRNGPSRRFRRGAPPAHEPGSSEVAAVARAVPDDSSV
ncbi:MAG: hypothetical protein AVDCRST_MAG27-2546, partial [uncultured Craurococcus sp.]